MIGTLIGPLFFYLKLNLKLNQKKWVARPEAEAYCTQQRF